MPTLNELAEILRPDARCLRVKNRSTIVAIAGSVGAVVADGEVRLALARLSPQARQAAEELADSGVCNIDPAGRLWVARLPHGDGETKLFFTALGLRRRSPYHD